MPNKKRLTIPREYIRAETDPSTFDAEKRTVEIVWSTGAKVLRRSWDGPFYEELLMGSENIRMDRLNNGAPLLDTHGRFSVKQQLGVVERAWLVNGEGRAVVRFSKREDVEPVFQDVKDGIVRKVSVGYRLWKLEKIEEADSDIPTMRAVDWEPNEISLAPMAADDGSQVRADEKEGSYEVEVEIINRTQVPKMNDADKKRLSALLNKQSLTDEERTEKEGLQTRAEEAGLDIDALKESTDSTRTPESNQKPESGKSGANPQDVTRAAESAVAAERQRVSQIRQAVRSAGLDEDFADPMISDGTGIDQARAAIIDEFAKQDPNKNSGGQVRAGADERDKLRSTMEDSLILRADPTDEDISDDSKRAAREFRGYDMMDLARRSLEMTGIKTAGMSKREVAETALGIRSAPGYHATSDFPILLGNTINRTLRREYDKATRTFTTWARRATISDFREVTRAQLGDLSPLEQVKEGAEYTYASMGEGKEVYKLTKYGKIIGVTWETIINDDLDFLSRLPQKMAARAATKQSQIVYSILTTNPEMGDGTALFHADHNNLAEAGSAISIDSLGAARAAMRKQKAPGDGKKKANDGDYININPRYLMVGPDNEQLALQYLSGSYNPDNPAQINPWSQLMQPVIDAHIEGDNWFVAADSGQVDTVEYAFLEGEEELFTEQRWGFDVDGLEVKVRMVFAAKAIDFRGLYKNPGDS